MVLNNDRAKQLIEVQEATASALNRISAALETNNETMAKMLEIENQKIFVEEKKSINIRAAGFTFC